LTIALLLPLRARDRTLPVGIRHNQAGIDREPFTADQACCDARLDHEYVAVAEALIAGTAKC
jgi:hypothetical protein